MAAYRRRPDGILEIALQRRPSRLRSTLSSVAAMLSLALLPAFGALVFVSLGMPLVVMAVLGTVAALVWLSRRSPDADVEPVLRLAQASSRAGVRRLP